MIFWFFFMLNCLLVYFCKVGSFCVKFCFVCFYLVFLNILFLKNGIMVFEIDINCIEFCKMVFLNE